MTSEEIIEKLKCGEQLTNGPQSIVYNPETGEGRLWCDTPDCCDSDFIDLEELMDYVIYYGIECWK